MNNTKGVLLGAVLVATLLIVLYVVLRQSKKSPITNVQQPVKQTVTQTRGIDWAGIGTGIGNILGTGGVGSLLGKK